jgi:hypothetical protein
MLKMLQLMQRLKLRTVVVTAAGVAAAALLTEFGSEWGL